jgi:hypothetical protein
MITKSGPFLRYALVTAATSAFFLSAQAGVCKRATTTGTWDTSTAKWTGTGSTWFNGNDAVFANTATASSITLIGAIKATSLLCGNVGNNGNHSLAGGTYTTSPITANSASADWASPAVTPCRNDTFASEGKRIQEWESVHGFLGLRSESK